MALILLAGGNFFRVLSGALENIASSPSHPPYPFLIPIPLQFVQVFHRRGVHKLFEFPLEVGLVAEAEVEGQVGEDDVGVAVEVVDGVLAADDAAEGFGG